MRWVDRKKPGFLTPLGREIVWGLLLVLAMFAAIVYLIEHEVELNTTITPYVVK